MGDNSNRLAGILSFTKDGVPYDVKGSGTYSVAKVTRESKVGQTGVAGYKEMPVTGKMSMTLYDTGGLSMADINATTNSTLVMALANGKVIVGRNMWSVETQDVNSEEGEVEVKFEGRSVTEN